MTSPSRPRKKRKYDIPLQKSLGTGYLIWIIALMIYMATIVLSANIALDHITGQWENTMTGRLTVEIPPTAGDNKIAASARADIIIQTLENTEGIISARRLGKEEILQLIDPWLGGIVAPEVLPMPTLIDVEVAKGYRVNVADLQNKIARQVPDARIDDHQAWLRDVLDLIGALKMGALTLTAAIFLTAIGAVAGAVRSRMALHGDSVNLLHLMGASDAYIARQFQRYAIFSTLKGGIIGTILSFVTLYAFARLAGQMNIGLLPQVTLTVGDWIILSAIPMASALIAMWTAKRTVIRLLKKMP